MKWWTFCHENQASLSWNENQFHDYSAVRFSPHPYEINRLLSYKCHQMTWAFNPIKLKNSDIIDDQDWFTGKKKGTSFDLIASESNEHSLICSKVCGALQQNTLERSGKSTEEEEEKNGWDIHEVLRLLLRPLVWAAQWTNREKSYSFHFMAKLVQIINSRGIFLFSSVKGSRHLMSL